MKANKSNEINVLIQQAGQGDKNAQYKLGHKYNTGDGVQQNDQQAIQWYTKAAQQNHQDAIEALKRLQAKAQTTSAAKVSMNSSSSALKIHNNVTMLADKVTEIEQLITQYKTLASHDESYAAQVQVYLAETLKHYKTYPDILNNPGELAKALQELEQTAEYFKTTLAEAAPRISVETMDIFTVAREGDTEKLSLLIQRGIDLNKCDETGSTALHLAISKRQRKFVKALLKQGVDTNIRDHKKRTALHLAVEKKSVSSVTELTALSGTDINAKDKKERTALHLAVEKGEMPILEILLKTNIKLDEQDKHGNTALYTALESKHTNKVELIKALIQAGADIDYVHPKSKETPRNLIIKLDKSLESLLVSPKNSRNVQPVPAVTKQTILPTNRNSVGPGILQQAQGQSQITYKPLPVPKRNTLTAESIQQNNNALKDNITPASGNAVMSGTLPQNPIQSQARNQTTPSPRRSLPTPIPASAVAELSQQNNNNNSVINKMMPATKGSIVMQGLLPQKPGQPGMQNQATPPNRPLPSPASKQTTPAATEPKLQNSNGVNNRAIPVKTSAPTPGVLPQKPVQDQATPPNRPLPSPTPKPATLVTDPKVPTNVAPKKKIINSSYGINYKKSEANDFPTELQAHETLNTKSSNQDKTHQEKNKVKIPEADLAELLKKGYTEQEIDTFQDLGITPLALKKLVNPELNLDIFQSIEVITTCIKMGKAEAEKVKAKDHNMVLIIGNTGAGKSTAVNYLHGCEMEKKSDGFTSLIVVKEDSQRKEVVAIGHGKSKTFIPSVIDSPETGIAFCDCPGFSDNRGQEVNISNAVNIRHTIENAKSVKILLLIDYKTIRESRGNGINNLLKTLDNLFGSNNSLAENAASILIGITQVPKILDDEEITLEKVRGAIARNERIPASIIPSIKILDPLERRVSEQCGRTDWLDAIAKLAPVKEHQSRFNTVLNSDDELMLINISKEISKQVNQDLASAKFAEAAKKLEQMLYLKIIRRQEIDRMYDDNLREVNNYTVGEERKIKKFADSYNWNEVYKAIMAYQQFVLIFKEVIPGLKDNFIQLINYINDKQVQQHQENVVASISALAKGYDQDRELQRRLAYPLHQLLNQAEPAINSNQALQHLGGYLKEMIALDCGPLKKQIEEVSNQLAALKGLSDKLNKKQIIDAGEEKLVKELKRIAETACRIHRENALEELKNINISVLEVLEKLKVKVEWQTNGKNILNTLKPLQNNMQASGIIAVLAELTKDASVKPEAEVLHNQLLKAQQVIASIVTAQPSQADADIPQLSNIVHESLLKIKAQLMAAQKEEELKVRKDKEQKEVEAAIHEIKSVIEHYNMDALKGSLAKIVSFNDEQKKLLNQTKEVSLLLSEKLQVNFDLIKLKLNWEANGRKILEILKNFRAPTNEAVLEKIFSDMQVIPEVKAAASAINFILIFIREAKGKLVLDPAGYIKTLDTYLTYIQGEMKKKQIEEDKRLDEENKRKESHELVARINNQLLPNSNFAELNSAISRLIQIAPDQLQLITLKTKIEEHRSGFHEQLAANNYDAVNGKLILLANYKKQLAGILSQMGINLELNEFYSAILQHISAASEAVLKEVLGALADEVILNSQGALKSLTKLEAFFNAYANFKDMSGVAQLTDTMVNNCIKHISSTVQRHSNTADAAIYAKLLMQIQCLSTSIGSSHSLFTVEVRKYVGKVIQGRGDVDFLGAVAQVLMAKVDEKTESSRYAEEVIAQYPEFKRAATQGFLTHTKDRTSDDIFRELKLDNNEKAVLKKCYDIYHQEYERIITEVVEKFEKPGDQELLASIIDSAQNHAKQLSSTTHYSKNPAAIATIVANTFGVWSYLDAHSGGFKSDRTTLLQPHDSQAISVLLLLGMHKPNEQAQNHFLQVGTGEGKSVDIAAASIVFALLGFRVYVACYNPWLARRDERNFSKLIQQFRLAQSITYGDFNYHVNEQIARMGNLRSLVQQLLRGDSSIQANQAKNEKSLLFVDEVDVFFSESFLGATYNPVQDLQSASYRELLVDIWNNRNNYLSMNLEQFCNAVSSHKLYGSFLKDYPNMESLIKLFLPDIYNGLKAVADGTHEYICKDGLIGYIDKVANTVRTTTICGHYTSFAAIKEYQANRLNDANLSYYASIMVWCGKFSYAELPNSYNMIVGVTGTLSSLSAFENKLLENYNVKYKTTIPSVFKKKQLEGTDKVSIFGGDMDAEDNLGYFYNIKKAVDAVISKDRAVLIVFENEDRLKEYQKYIIKHPYSSKTIRTNTLLTTTDDQTRDLRVAEAASRSRVTEMAREFGRGSDFVCRDSQLRKSGGVHVLCAFFPEHEAEEVQIKGRTCRQIDPGSFEMIIFLDDLKKYNITSQNEIDQAPSKYNFLVQKRNEYQAQKSAQIQAKLDKSKASHQQTLKLADMLKNNSFFSRIIPGQKDEKKTQALEIIRQFSSNSL